MKDKKIRLLVYSAFFTALGYVLPFLTGQIPEVGAMLCPMHIPVILCGFICSWPWGMAVGFIVPLLRSLTIGIPALFPRAICMALELGAYGAAAGIFYRVLPKKKIFIYLSLVLAMLAGRFVWGLSMWAAMGISGGSFGFSAFIAGAFTNALPGILIQILIIPPIVMVWEKYRKADGNGK